MPNPKQAAAGIPLYITCKPVQHSWNGFIPTAGALGDPFRNVYSAYRYFETLRDGVLNPVPRRGFAARQSAIAGWHWRFAIAKTPYGFGRERKANS